MKDHLQSDYFCEECQESRPANSSLFGGPLVGRREFFKIAGLGVAGSFVSPIFSKVVKADTAAELYGRARNCIFVHMQGAPSHVDTFDLKVGAWTPADFTPETFSGIVFPKGLMPTLANHVGKMAIIRSVRAPALVHGLQQTWTQIARNPTSQMGRIAPNIGAVVAREFEPQRQPRQVLPGFISLNGGSLVSSGYFSARFSPFAAAGSTNGLGNLLHFGQTTSQTFDSRYQMLQALDSDNRVNSPLGDSAMDMDSFYTQSRAMMYNSEVDAAFRLTTAETQRYGVNNAQTGFGNSCLVARNLVKANLGARFIQINIGGWDNHTNIYAANGIYNPARQFDKGLGELMTDLASTPGINGGTLLDETLIVWMGEFGRTVRTANNSTTPGINSGGGRDHYFQHFVGFAGGGVSGGRVIGETTSDGFAVANPGWSAGRPVVNEDIAATIYSALGIDYTKKLNDDPFQRGFEYVPFASQGVWKPVTEVFQRITTPERPRISPRKR